jgi:hypothetical protein
LWLSGRRHGARSRDNDSGADRIGIDLESERLTGPTQRLGFAERDRDEVLKRVEVVPLPFDEGGIERATAPQGIREWVRVLRS